jgi:hypothetical protein
VAAEAEVEQVLLETTGKQREELLQFMVQQ